MAKLQGHEYKFAPENFEWADLREDLAQFYECYENYIRNPSQEGVVSLDWAYVTLEDGSLKHAEMYDSVTSNTAKSVREYLNSMVQKAAINEGMVSNKQ